MKIKSVKCNFVRDSLRSPFGFKGNYVTELWQPVVLITGEDGSEGLGPGVQSVLWSDAGIFARYHGTWKC